MSTHIDRADEVFVPHQNVGHAYSPNNGEDPSSHKTFHCLLGRELDELCFAKGNAADVGKYVVANDQGYREEEPYHPLKHIVHNEMGLDHNKI